MVQKAASCERDSSEKGLSSSKPQCKQSCCRGHTIRQIPHRWWEKMPRRVCGRTGRITMLVSGVLEPSHAIYSEELHAFEKQFLVCCWALVDMEGMAKGQQTAMWLELPIVSWVLPVPPRHKFGWDQQQSMVRWRGRTSRTKHTQEQRAQTSPPPLHQLPSLS